MLQQDYTITTEELLEEIIKDYKVFDKTHNFKVDSERNLSMYADRKLIKQAIRIFMDNAVKYTAEDGSVLLKSYVSNNKLYFIIKDNGIGISENDLPKIFDRFYRADTSRDKKSGGSGLGLAIAKIILDLGQQNLISGKLLKNLLKISQI